MEILDHMEGWYIKSKPSMLSWPIVTREDDSSHVHFNLTSHHSIEPIYECQMLKDRHETFPTIAPRLLTRELLATKLWLWPIKLSHMWHPWHNPMAWFMCSAECESGGNKLQHKPCTHWPQLQPLNSCNNCGKQSFQYSIYRKGKYFTKLWKGFRLTISFQT